MMKVNRLNYSKIHVIAPCLNCAIFIFWNLALTIFSKPRQTLSRKYRIEEFNACLSGFHLSKQAWVRLKLLITFFSSSMIHYF